MARAKPPTRPGRSTPRSPGTSCETRSPGASLRLHRERRQPRRPPRPRPPGFSERRARGDLLGRDDPQGRSRCAESAADLRHQRTPYLASHLARRPRDGSLDRPVGSAGPGASLRGCGSGTGRAGGRRSERRDRERRPGLEPARALRDAVDSFSPRRRVRLRSRRPGGRRRRLVEPGLRHFRELARVSSCFSSNVVFPFSTNSQRLS